MRVPVSLASRVRRDAGDGRRDRTATRDLLAGKVERVMEVGVTDEVGNLGRFVVGRVVSAEPNSNADRLQLCRSTSATPTRSRSSAARGTSARATCRGRASRRAPSRAPASRGAPAPRAGVEDDLAEDEIGLGADHAIMLLPDGLEPGTPLADVMPLVDQVLDAGPTMNRPDLLSMVGIAREVAALCDGSSVADPADPPVVQEEPVDIRVEDLEVPALHRPRVPRRPRDRRRSGFAPPPPGGCGRSRTSST